jgi:CheY-like chemotaxis protein
MALKLEVKKILVADDYQGMLDLIKMFLKDLGCEVVEARDGEELVRLAVETRPDLMVVDVCLPRMNGYEAVNKLVNEKGFKDPVLFCSGVARDAQLFRSNKPSCPSAFILKPFTQGEFVEQLKALLDQ